MQKKLLTTQIEFEMTNHCNASCVFCPRHDPRTKGFISFETIEAGINLAKACNINGFKISGFGEPTLHKELISYLAHIRKEIPDTVILLITNGSLLVPKMFDALAAIPISHINISFNGYDQESYESQMQGLKFERVIENLRYIAKTNCNRLNIQFTPIMSKAFGEKEIEKMKDLLRGIGFKDKNFNFKHIITARSGKLKDPKLIDAEFIDALKDKEIKDKTKVLCLRALETLYVSWQGKILLCCNDVYGEAVIGEITKLKTAEDLQALEQKNIALRKSYHFDLCTRCDRPLIGPHQIKGESIFSL